MSAVLIAGPIFPPDALSVDDQGNKTYKVMFQVAVNASDGPNAVYECPGLPLPGTPWIWEDLVDNTVVCLPRCEIKRHTAYDKDNVQVIHWFVTFTYSSNVCQVIESLDPLLQPQKITGDNINFTEEATEDRFGVPILNSAYEPVRGQIVEFDAGRDQVIIEQNVPLLELDLLASLKHNLNDEPMWGAPRRCVKFSSYSWREACRGIGEAYYIRRLVFDIFIKKNPEAVEGNPDYLVSGFDRKYRDVGQKVLFGHWEGLASQPGKWVLDPIGLDPTTGEIRYGDWRNPSDFQCAVDRHGNPTTLVLDGRGKPYDPDSPPSKWWCVRPFDGDPYTFEGTCTDAIALLDDFDELYGPYEQESDAQATAALTEQELAAKGEQPYDPSFCEGRSKPGEFPLEKYDDDNLFLLGIPTTFGVGYVGGGGP
jgi:hypothetical protein